MRASVAAEAAGVPSVSLLCEGFERQAAATARGVGFDGLAVAVMRGHVDSQTIDDVATSFVAHTLEQVIDGLTGVRSNESDGDDEPGALDIVVSGTVEEINHHFADHGWSEGLAIIPPTRDSVTAFIEPSGNDAWRLLGTARPSGRDITVWAVAVNAVMAGCRPEELPVLLAIAEIIAGQSYGVEHSGNTTGADALVVLNGPVITDLGFNYGQGALREGARANTAVARWLRLFLRNVCGFTAEEHDKATFGNSTRVVLAEDEAALAEIGWPPFSADFGFTRGDDVVTMVRINGGLIVGSVFGSSPEEILPYLADGLVRVTGWELTHVYGLGHGDYRPLLVLSPVLAGVFARAGWSKQDVRRALFEQARMPAWRFEKLIGEWSNLTAGRRTLSELAENGLLPDEFARSDNPERLVPIVTATDKIMIAVAGDPNRTNAYVMSNDGLHGAWTSAAIDRAYSSDLVCRVDNREACG